MISNRTIAQARGAHYETIGRLNIPFGNSVPELCVGDFCVTGFSCTGASLGRTQVRPQPAAGQLPLLTVRLDGLMQDQTPVVGEDTQKVLRLDMRDIGLVPGASFEESPPISMTRSDDDTRFDFTAQARLKEDGETVEVRFQAAFSRCGAVKRVERFVASTRARGRFDPKSLARGLW